MFKIIMFLWCAFAFINGKAQSSLTKKPLIFSIDFGVDKSTCIDNVDTKQGELNPSWHIQYFSKRRYDKPGLRLQGSIMLQANKNFAMGLQSGATVHFSQRYYGVKSIVVLAVPVQAKISSRIVTVKQSIIYLDLAGGVNISKVAVSTYKESTGPLFSAGLMLHLRNDVYLRSGFEHQTDKGSYTIYPDTYNDQKFEVIAYNQRREQIYFVIGYSF